MITIPSVALQIWSMIAFADVTMSAYSTAKIISISVGILSIGPTIVSLDKFMNEHAQGTLQQINNTVQKRKETENGLNGKLSMQSSVTSTDQTNFVSFDDSEIIQRNQARFSSFDHDDSRSYEHDDAETDSDDGFDLDAEVPIGFKAKIESDDHVDGVEDTNQPTVPRRKSVEHEQQYRVSLAPNNKQIGQTA